MKNLLNKHEAYIAALQQANITDMNARLISIRLADCYYEMDISTDWMRYTCYVGAMTGELCGIDCIPTLPEMDSLDGVSRVQLLGVDDLAA